MCGFTVILQSQTSPSQDTLLLDVLESPRVLFPELQGADTMDPHREAALRQGPAVLPAANAVLAAAAAAREVVRGDKQPCRGSALAALHQDAGNSRAPRCH